MIQHLPPVLRPVLLLFITMVTANMPELGAPPSPFTPRETFAQTYTPPTPRAPIGDCYVNTDVGYTFLRAWMSTACGVFQWSWRIHGAIPNNQGAYAVITGAGRHPVYENRAEHYHLEGNAMDLRTRNIRSPTDLVNAFDLACNTMVELHPEFRAVLIINKPGFGDHVHTEMRTPLDTDKPSCDYSWAHSSTIRTYLQTKYHG